MDHSYAWKHKKPDSLAKVHCSKVPKFLIKVHYAWKDRSVAKALAVTMVIPINMDRSFLMFFLVLQMHSSVCNLSSNSTA